jgi:TrpR-related protein YerC/YecD
MDTQPIASGPATGRPADAPAPPPLVPLAVAIAALQTPGEAERVLADLLTPAERHALDERWRVAQLLDRGHSYREVAARAPASTTTVTRVAKFLKDMPHKGYRLLIDRLKAGS